MYTYLLHLNTYSQLLLQLYHEWVHIVYVNKYIQRDNNNDTDDDENTDDNGGGDDDDDDNGDDDDSDEYDEVNDDSDDYDDDDGGDDDGMVKHTYNKNNMYTERLTPVS